MGERERIARHFAPLTTGEPGAFALTDDAALLSPPTGQNLVITTDSVIEGIHVLSSATPQQFVVKLMRRNLSDLAAMGATSWRYTLNLHTPPDLPEDWFAAFAAAMASEQQQFGMALAGGDSTSGNGPIHATMTCFGLISGAPLLRSGAQLDDDLYVSGTLGDAAYVLALLQQNKPVEDALALRYHAPTPRLELGQMLRGVATAAIDISDGLVSDVQQLCVASHSGAVIEQKLLPVASFIPPQFALSGGDDYELCFTVPVAKRDAIAAIAQQLDLPLTRIGQITDSGRVIVMDDAKHEIALAKTGWEHA